MSHSNVRVTFEVPYDKWPAVEAAVLKAFPREAINTYIIDGLPNGRKPLSDEGLHKLEAIVVDFIDRHHVRSAESAYQMDHIQEMAPELVIAVGNLVGYYEDLPEDDE